MARPIENTARKARELEPAYVEAAKLVGTRETRYSGSPAWDKRRAEAFDRVAEIVRGSASSEERATFTLGRLYELVNAALEPQTIVLEYERLHDTLLRSKEPATPDPTEL